MEPSRCPGGPPSAGARLSYSEGMFGSCFPGAVGTGCWAEAPGVGSRHRRPGPCAWPVCQPEAVWLGVPVFRGHVRVSCLHVLRSEASLGGRPPAFAHWMCASALPNTGLHCPGLHPSQVPSDRTVGTVITRLWLDMALRHVDVSPPPPGASDACMGLQRCPPWPAAGPHVGLDSSARLGHLRSSGTRGLHPAAPSVHPVAPALF